MDRVYPPHGVLASQLMMVIDFIGFNSIFHEFYSPLSFYYLYNNFSDLLNLTQHEKFCLFVHFPESQK